MDNFNKVVSFILGLVVVVVFFAVVSGRLNLGRISPNFAKKTTLSPTPKTTLSPTPKKNLASTVEENTKANTNNNKNTNNTYKVNNYLTNTKSIPATGLPTFFIPSVFASGLAGVFLRKTSKK